jgi:hypothetical protein
MTQVDEELPDARREQLVHTVAEGTGALVVNEPTLDRYHRDVADTPVADLELRHRTPPLARGEYNDAIRRSEHAEYTPPGKARPAENSN